jgi:hypothetical protein
MKRTVSSNGIKMIKNQQYWWEIKRKYADGTGSEYYYMSIGGLGEMYSLIYNTETNQLSISQIGYSYDWVVRLAIPFSECDKMVDAFRIPLDMEVMPLFINPNP